MKKILGNLIAACMCGFLLNTPSAGLAQAVWPQQGVPDHQQLRAKVKADGPRLLFSDSPEMVYATGILYRDTLQGEGRLFFHHVNGTSKLKKLAILVKNNGLRPASFTVTHSGIDGPSHDYQAVGKKSQEYYFADQKPHTTTLGFGKTTELLGGQGTLLPPDKLLTGTIDFISDRPVEITVLLCEPQSDIELFSVLAQQLPMDEHPLRGTFAKADLNYTLQRPIETETGTGYALLLADSQTGEYLRGLDATTGLPAENYGNYGVVYNIDYKLKGDKPYELWLNPWGGMFAGVGVLEQGGERKLINIPDKPAFGRLGEEGFRIATLEPNSEGRFTWSPPGASNLPIRLFWLPADYKAPHLHD